MALRTMKLSVIYSCQLYLGKDLCIFPDFILTELWHLLDVSAVAGHGAELVALLFFYCF